MKHRRTWIIVWIGVLFFNGCAFFQDYTRQTAPVRMAVSTGNYAEALTLFGTRTAGGNDAILMHMERGILLQAMGKFKDSAAEFEAAAAAIEASQNRAVISASKTVSGAASLMINEKALPYTGADFEKVLIHTYDALNYVMLKDLEGARVEIRNAYRIQQELYDKHFKELENAQKEKTAAAWENQFRKADAVRYERMVQTAQGVESIYQNAFAYYISAYVYELNREYDEAYIDLKKAIIAAPQSRSIQRDLIRLSKELHYSDDFERWEKRFGKLELAPRDGIDIFVVFETGLAPYKEQLTFPIPIASGFVAAAFPVYQFSPMTVLAGRVTCGDRNETTSIVADMDAIAARTLLDEFPILFAKQIARSTLKGLATREVNRQHGAGWALLASLAALITEQADLRTWSTLPKQVQVARLIVPSSARQVDIASVPVGASTRIDIPAGTKHLIIVARAPDGVLTIQSQAY